MENRQPKPEWLKVKYDPAMIDKMNALMEGLSLHTVCMEADCPNRGECFCHNTATFMILGANCTRRCRYCAVSKGPVCIPDPQEPENIAKAAQKLGLRHVVVTSVTRDDLRDGGALHFAETIRALRAYLPESAVEVLIPDFKGNQDSLDLIIREKPDIIGHNVETVPQLYQSIRPQADYARSLGVLEYIKKSAPDIVSKTGIMLGLGETQEQVESVMDDLIAVSCDILTIGQYLAPSREHAPVMEYVTPQKFDGYQKLGEQKGFKFVASGPLVRSSYRALEALTALKNGDKKHGLC